MKKLILISILILSLATYAVAHVGGLWSIGGGVSSGDVPIFQWDCNSTTPEISGADKLITIFGEASVSGGKLVITDGTGNGGDYGKIDILNYDIMPQADFTFEVKMTSSGVSDWSSILLWDIDGNNTFNIRPFLDGGETYHVNVYHKGSGTQKTVSSDSLTYNTEYSVIVRGSTTLGLEISTDGGATWNSTTSITAMNNGTLNNAPIGEGAGVLYRGELDEFRMYDKWRTY